MDVRPRLGIIGGGRLAEGIAKTWLARTGQAPVIWSRSGPRDNRISEATWTTKWTGTLEAESVAVAIPGRALLELAGGNEQAKQFTGNVFNAAASLSRASLQHVFPQATIVFIAPFLIDGANSIPMVALRPANLSDAEWTKANAALDDFGDCDVVEDEAAFAQLYLLGAAWPAVILAAVRAAADAGVQRLENEIAIDLGRRIFFRGINSLLNAETSGEIATPGGITERGLKSLGEVTVLFHTVFQQMQARAEELRA